MFSSKKLFFTLQESNAIEKMSFWSTSENKYWCGRSDFLGKLVPDNKAMKHYTNLQAVLLLYGLSVHASVCLCVCVCQPDVGTEQSRCTYVCVSLSVCLSVSAWCWDRAVSVYIRLCVCLC